MRSVGRKWRLDTGVPNMPWHVRWAGWVGERQEVWNARKVEDKEGDGGGHGRTRREKRRSGVSSGYYGCQADCHVNYWDWLLWASGCFGVYFKGTGCEHENIIQSPPYLSHLSHPFHYSFHIRSFSASLPERATSAEVQSL